MAFSSLPASETDPTLVERLKQAIDADDLAEVRSLVLQHPALHRAPLGYNRNGPLTWAAECRAPGQPTIARLEMARWMLENGSEVHQGGDGPLMRAALSDRRLPMLELLLEYGADVNALWNGHYPILCAPCETLAPAVLRWLLTHGADPRRIQDPDSTPLSMVVRTYCRDARARGECLEVLDACGCRLPDTAPCALHRRRYDLLEEHLSREPDLLQRRFRLSEIYPGAPGQDPAGGLTATPVEGVTLLHLALEQDDLEMAEWLVERGADVNAPAVPGPDGFCTHTPLFHAVVSLGSKDGAKVAFLLQHGADPGRRATLRKQLRDMGDREKEGMREFREVSAAEYARGYVEPRWVCTAGVALLEGTGA